MTHARSVNSELRRVRVRLYRKEQGGGAVIQSCAGCGTHGGGAVHRSGHAEMSRVGATCAGWGYSPTERLAGCGCGRACALLVAQRLVDVDVSDVTNWT